MLRLHLDHFYHSESRLGERPGDLTASHGLGSRDRITAKLRQRVVKIIAFKFPPPDASRPAIIRFMGSWPLWKQEKYVPESLRNP